MKHFSKPKLADETRLWSRGLRKPHLLSRSPVVSTWTGQTWSQFSAKDVSQDP